MIADNVRVASDAAIVGRPPNLAFRRVNSAQVVKQRIAAHNAAEMNERRISGQARANSAAAAAPMIVRLCCEFVRRRSRDHKSDSISHSRR